MSEGKYGKLPKPKDRSKHVDVTMGEVSLTPTHDKAGEWEEEGEALTPHPAHQERHQTTAMERIKMAAESLGAAATRPWAKLMGDKDDEE